MTCILDRWDMLLQDVSLFLVLLKGLIYKKIK